MKTLFHFWWILWHFFLFSKLDFGPLMPNNEEIRVGLEVLVIEMHLSNIEEALK